MDQLENEAYADWCDMMGVVPSSEAWMAYCEWRQAGNEMA